MVFKKLYNWYNTRGPVGKAVIETEAIQGGLSLASKIFKYATDNAGLADGLSIASPVAAGAYAIHKSNGIKNKPLRYLTQAAIAGLMGGSTTSNLENLVGGTNWADSLRNNVEQFNYQMANLTGTDSFYQNGLAAALLAFGVAAIAKNLPSNKPASPSSAPTVPAPHP